MPTAAKNPGCQVHQKCCSTKRNSRVAGGAVRAESCGGHAARPGQKRCRRCSIGACTLASTHTWGRGRRGEDAAKAADAVEAERSGEGSAPNGSGSGNLGSSKGANGSSRCQAAGAGDSATKACGAQCQGSNQPQARPGSSCLPVGRNWPRARVLGSKGPEEQRSLTY